MDFEKAKARAEELSKELKYHNNRYYNQDEPEISDYEYDMLLRELEQIEDEFPNLIKEDSPTQRVGGERAEKFSPVEHIVPMESLHDSFSVEELRDFDRKVRDIVNNPAYVVEPKFDGLSVSAEYRNGIFVRGSTRGDGRVGEDITDNLKTIKSLPHRLSKPVDYLEVRGEVYMSNDSFLDLLRYQEEHEEKPFKNPTMNHTIRQSRLSESTPCLPSMSLSYFALSMVYFSIKFCKTAPLSHYVGYRLSIGIYSRSSAMLM